MYTFISSFLLKKSCLSKLEESYRLLVTSLEELIIQYNWKNACEGKRKVLKRNRIKERIEELNSILLELIQIYEKIENIKNFRFKLELGTLYEKIEYHENKNVLKCFVLETLSDKNFKN